MERCICIHGHFYQPPRENAWLEEIEQQDSAYPFHDWNERINSECYAPNSASRILDQHGDIVEIVNNYARISFNFGPTLLAWMQVRAPEVLAAVVRADRDSQRRFSGHGSALAQVYNHMILPLANARDKRTQVLWGIGDFEHRFGRRPAGMWLPETAVDEESLAALAEQGMRFTVLAPHQAARVREIGAAGWQEPDNGSIDPSMPYLVRLPHERAIAVFFYDGPISRAVAFERLLSSGAEFAERLRQGFDASRPRAQLVHIATDGETYGHHHRHGDMALAFALHELDQVAGADHDDVRLTNYAEFLEQHPPTHEVEVVANSSWSCAHGIGRWRSNCGCSSGSHPSWNQEWRAPLREALEWLRDRLAPLWEERAARWLGDPWRTRDDYVRVALDRSEENVERFLNEHATADLARADTVEVLKLLELQRHAMLMFTSCGWFFDDLAGIETVQVIQYAGRALQLGQELFGVELEQDFLARLVRARSNQGAHVDGRSIWLQQVRPAMVDLHRVAAHFAASSIFQRAGKVNRVYCYAVDLAQAQGFESGKARLMVGRGDFTSQITREAEHLSFWAFHLGDHNLHAGVRRWQGQAPYEALLAECREAFTRGDWPQLVRLMDRYFPDSTFSLKSLFRDEQRRVLDRIMADSLAGVEAAYRKLHDDHAPLLRLLAEIGLPAPRAFVVAAEFAINAELRRALQDEELDVPRIEGLLEQARAENVTLDARELAHVFAKCLERIALWLQRDPGDLRLLQRLHDAARLARALPFAVNEWTVQNVYYALLHDTYPELRRRARMPAAEGAQWVETFLALGRAVAVHVPDA